MILKGDNMSPQRLLRLTITTAAVAVSAALVATGTPERVHGAVWSATAAPATAYTYGGKPIAVSGQGKYQKSEGSNLSKIGDGGFVGITTEDVDNRRVVRTALVSNEAPARIANIWGGFDHQPTEAQVQHAERARGVAPDAEQERREERILRQLNQTLLKSAGAATG